MYAAFTNRATLLYQQGRYQQAADELRRGLVEDPNDAHAQALLALCLVSLKQYDAAQAEAQNAIVLAPDYAFAHYALAVVLFDRRRWEAAETAIREALRLAPGEADYLALLSNIRLNLDQFEDALHAAEEGLAASADHAGCLNLRAMALVKLNRREEADRTIQGALHKAPENAFTHANQGWTCLHQGDRARALEHFREALRLNPGLDWARQGMMTALKARYFIYRWMLVYFLFMARLSRRARWAVIIGVYVGVQVLRGLGGISPALQMVVLPLVIAYFAFVLLSWTADPLFNVLLRFNSFGKYLLRPEQRRCSEIIAMLLGLAVMCAIASLLLGSVPGLLIAGLLVLLMIPTAATFALPLVWPRWVMAAYTVGAAALAVTGLLLNNDTGVTLAMAGVLAIAFSSWVGNFIGAGRRTR